MGRKKLKVYGWSGWSGGQSRNIVAASSAAEVGRIVGEHPRRLFNLEETGNEEEIVTALSAPGVVFWKPYQSTDRGFRAEGSSELVAKTAEYEIGLETTADLVGLRNSPPFNNPKATAVRVLRSKPIGPLRIRLLVVWEEPVA